jgi:hypothetical protein
MGIQQFLLNKTNANNGPGDRNGLTTYARLMFEVCQLCFCINTLYNGVEPKQGHYKETSTDTSICSSKSEKLLYFRMKYGNDITQQHSTVD